MTAPTPATAATEGAAAYAAGLPSTDCPYRDDAAALRRAWVTGYVRARTTALYGPQA